MLKNFILSILSLLGWQTCQEVSAPIDIQLRKELRKREVVALPLIESDSLRLYELGKSLFHNKQLSKNGKISCATCHQRNKGLGTGTTFPESFFHGISDDLSDRYLSRNAPDLFNLAFKKNLFWDGRVRLQDNSLIATPESRLNESDREGAKILSALREGSCLRVAARYQSKKFAIPKLDSKGCVEISHIASLVLFPLSSPNEMRGNSHPDHDRFAYWNWVVNKRLDSSTQREVLNSFPNISSIDEINIGHIGRALAEYIVLEFQAIDSPLDRYIGKNQDSALSLEEKQGALIFLSDKARCTQCHSGPMLSDGNFHSVAIPQFGPGIENGDDLGAFDKLTDQHFYSFRTPSLRNLSLTSPYMHNGAFRNLKEVIHFYNDIFTGLTNYVPPRHPAAHLNFQENKSTYVDRLAILNAPVREPLGLTDDQVNKMETFLRRSLTSSSQRDISSK